MAFASGEDNDYPVEELNTHGPSTKGWQSPRFCEYPQEIGLALETRAHLSRVQILSHQSKIATKIELFVGDGPSYEEAHFERLGYLSLNNNQRSNYQARELKSVFIDCTGRYLKLLAHRCYVNKYNLFNQVGIIAVNLLGEPAPLGARAADGLLSGPSHATAAGAGAAFLSAAAAGGGAGGGGGQVVAPSEHDLAYEMSPFDPETTRQLHALTQAKEDAVRREDYDTAKRLKAAEQELRGLGGQIAELEAIKLQAVKEEDYDRAKTLKTEITVLRHNMDAQLRPYLDGRLPPPSAATTNSSSPPRHHLQTQAEPVRQQQHVMTSSAYDEIPVGAAGRRNHTQGTGASQHQFSHPLHHDSDPIEVGGPPPPPPPASSSSSLSPPRRPGLFDENAPIQVNTSTHSAEEEAGSSPRQPSSSHGDKSWAYQGDGPHPLAGIPTYNWRELPYPEPMEGTPKVPGLEPGDVQAITFFFGEYWTRCFFSRNWMLRDAAVVKARVLVEEGGVEIQEAISAVGDVLALSVDDKIAQVFMSSLLLLDAALEAAKGARLKRSQVGPLMEPVIATLVGKLGDGQARIREAALAGLAALSLSPCVGPGGLGPYALRKLTGKQVSAGKTVHCRLVLLRRLLEAGKGGGLTGPNAGLTVDGVFHFMKEVNAFSHSSVEVREAARDVTVLLYKVLGSKVYGYIEPLLRKKQMDEYEAAFRQSLGEDAPPLVSPNRLGGGGGRGGGSGSHEDEDVGFSQPPSRAARAPANGKKSLIPPPPSSYQQQYQQQQKKPQAKQQQPAPPEEESFEVSFADTTLSSDFTCQFCGLYDPSFTEDALDHHYFVDCPLLMRCQEVITCPLYPPTHSLFTHPPTRPPPQCGQVIEIFGLAEHLLTECEAKDEYVPCARSGLAVRQDQMDAWRTGPGAYFEQSLPEGSKTALCPLCFYDIAPSTEEGIKTHYAQMCANNPRRVEGS